MSACVICTRPVGDNAYICQEDTQRLEVSLGDVRWIDQQLDVVLTRQTATGERVGGASVEKPLPYDPRATEARWVLGNTITTWARVVSEERPATLPTIGGLGITAAWLSSYVGWLRHHAAAEDAWDEIGSAIAAARRLIDTRPERFYAGPCGGLDGVECGQDLYAKVTARDITCPGCSAKYDATARREWLVEAANDHLASASEVVALCKAMLGDLISKDMVKGYVRRGKLAAHGTKVDKQNRVVATYRIGDVIAAATQAQYDEREQRATRKAGRVA